MAKQYLHNVFNIEFPNIIYFDSCCNSPNMNKSEVFNKLTALQRCDSMAKLLNKKIPSNTFYCEEGQYADEIYAPDGTYELFICDTVCLKKAK